MFSFKENQKTFISVDCIESTYILQNLFLSLLKPQNFHEYFDYEFLNKQINIKQKNSIFHIPTWRMNIVENESVDLITSVFVLPEINEFAFYMERHLLACHDGEADQVLINSNFNN